MIPRCCANSEGSVTPLPPPTKTERWRDAGGGKGGWCQCMSFSGSKTDPAVLCCQRTTTPGPLFITGHILVIDTEYNTGRGHHSSYWRRRRSTLSFQAHHPSVRHSPSIYACSQNTEMSDQDLSRVLNHNECHSFSF